MKIVVEKRNDKYIAILRNISEVPKKVLIQKSWDSSYNKEEFLNYNLFEEDLDLINNLYDLLNFEIELDENIENTNDFYKLYITTEKGLVYPFYITYNMFYNIKQNDKIYFYDVIKPGLKLKDNESYDFFILGNYGDKHRLNIFRRKGKRFYFYVPEDKHLFSEFYYIIMEKEGTRLLKDYLSLYPKKHKISFTVDVEDLSHSFKCKISTKHKYDIIKKLSIKYKNKTIDVHNNYSTEIYIEKTGIENNLVFDITATVLENYINAKEIEEKFIINKTLDNKEQISIKDFNEFYDFNLDTYFINWSSSVLIDKYKVTIANNSFFTDKPIVSIKEVKKLNNQLDKLPFKIEVDISGQLFKIFEIELDNPHVIYESSNFTPIIDYQDYVNSEGQIGNISWTVPNYKYNSSIKVSRVLTKPFLDENIKPWISEGEYALRKNPLEFNNVYADMNKLYNYDFGKEGTPKNAPVTFVQNSDSFIFLGEKNNINIPKWFTENDSKIIITVKIYDQWNNLKGENSVEFKDFTVSKKLKDDEIIIKRNQTIQFGETGTIGDYDSKKNAGPLEVYKHYAPENITYLGFPKNNPMNTDENNLSLYYYLSCADTTKTLDLLFKRTSNHREVIVDIYKNETKIISFTVKFLGNDFNRNILKIPKNRISEEGEYVMKLTTVNTQGLVSEEKVLNFYVFNEKPKKPIIKIPDNQFDTVEGKMIINRKYFTIDVINNSRSDKYAGWIFKEVHFFFKEDRTEETYNNYPDYVIQASKENGTIKLLNKTPFVNGNYKCKVCAYDYSGNKSLEHEFNFGIKASISIEPEKTLTNDTSNNFKWYIRKAEDSDGFFYQLGHTSDILQPFNFKEPVKVNSPYYISDPTTKALHTLETEWFKDIVGSKLGFYKLIVYEYNYKYPEGVSQKYESEIVELDKTGNISHPINAVSMNDVAVFNSRKHDEWCYTSDLDLISFTTTHDESLIEEDLSQPENLIKGKIYKLQVIPPSGSNTYSCTLPYPRNVGLYSFDRIKTKCGITDEEEGVWTIKFITRDKFGNSNERIGHFTYKVVVVKRNPEITNLTPSNSNGSEYFSELSTNIGFYTFINNYNNIVNYSQYQHMFDVKTIKVKFLSSPLNYQFELRREKNSQNYVKVLDDLTPENKTRHNLDGRYLVSFTAIDFLGRESLPVEKTFYIDTKMDYEFVFLNHNKFVKREVDLYMSCSNNIKKIHYKFVNSLSEINPELRENSDVLQTLAGINEYNSERFYGFKIPTKNYSQDGEYYFVYWLEEESSNLTEMKSYKITVDTSNRLIPIFDFTNKVLFTTVDKLINITWNSTHKDVTGFEMKLDKVELNNAGEYEVVDRYMLEVQNNQFVKLGPTGNSFVDLEDKRYISVELTEHSLLSNGVYRLTLRGANVYGTTESNEFYFQILKHNFITLSDKITKNKITIDSNRISWGYIGEAESYEISYDGKNFINTKFNYYNLDKFKLIKDEHGKTYIYIRYRSASGNYSEIEKIEIISSLDPVETPKVECEKVSINNRQLVYNVIIERPEKVSHIYYSFNKKDWNAKLVEGSNNRIINDTIPSPIPDGIYDIFVLLTDDTPLGDNIFNKSQMVHNSIKLFAQDIEKPRLMNIRNGSSVNSPQGLYIENKKPDVDYFIYVNNRQVNEGFILESSTIKTCEIVIKARKKGRNEILTLINQGEMIITVFTGSTHIITIDNEKITCLVDPLSETLEIISKNNIFQNQLFMYKLKTEEEWKVLNIGDKLDLNSEYEFRLINFKVSGE